MKPDGRFVENIEHIDELAAYLGSQTYALALSARQRCARAVERKIFKTHVKQEFQPRPDFLHYLHCDKAALAVYPVLQTLAPFIQFLDVHVGHIGDVLSIDVVMQRDLIETLSTTFRTYRTGIELLAPFLGLASEVIALLGLDVFHQSFVA